MESLLISHLKQEGIHVYVANVHPFMKVKTDEGKEYYCRIPSAADTGCCALEFGECQPQVGIDNTS